MTKIRLCNSLFQQAFFFEHLLNLWSSAPDTVKDTKESWASLSSQGASGKDQHLNVSLDYKGKWFWTKGWESWYRVGDGGWSPQTIKSKGSVVSTDLVEDSGTVGVLWLHPTSPIGTGGQGPGLNGSWHFRGLPAWILRQVWMDIRPWNCGAPRIPSDILLGAGSKMWTWQKGSRRFWGLGQCQGGSLRSRQGVWRAF